MAYLLDKIEYPQEGLEYPVNNSPLDEKENLVNYSLSCGKKFDSLYRGMVIRLRENRLNIYGFGSIKYNDNHKYVFGSLEIDNCVKDLDIGTHDIGVITTRDLENSLSIGIGTIEVLFLTSLFSFGTYSLVKYLSKK